LVFVLIPRRDSGSPGIGTRISHPTVHTMPSQVSHGRLAVCARIQERLGRLSRFPASSTCGICENSQPLGLITFLRAAHKHHHRHRLHPVRRARTTNSAVPPSFTGYLGTPRESESMTPAAILAVVLLSCLAIASFAGYKARQVYRTAREEAKETRDTAVARRRLAALQANDDPLAETAQEEQELREIRPARTPKQGRGPLDPPPV
jgi:hypothetical protein